MKFLPTTTKGSYLHHHYLCLDHLKNMSTFLGFFDDEDCPPSYPLGLVTIRSRPSFGGGMLRRLSTSDSDGDSCEPKPRNGPEEEALKADVLNKARK